MLLTYSVFIHVCSTCGALLCSSFPEAKHTFDQKRCHFTLELAWAYWRLCISLLVSDLVRSIRISQRNLRIAVGIQEKLSFNSSCNLTGRWKGEQLKGSLTTDCILGNSIGLTLLLTLVVLIVTIWHAKHPSEEHIVATVDREESRPLLGSGSTARVAKQGELI